MQSFCGSPRFMIGREKDPDKSEVAQLIQQSLAQDRARETMRERGEQNRLQQLEDHFHPKDDIMEHHLQDHLGLQQQQQVLVVWFDWWAK